MSSGPPGPSAAEHRPGENAWRLCTVSVGLRISWDRCCPAPPAARPSSRHRRAFWGLPLYPLCLTSVSLLPSPSLVPPSLLTPVNPNEDLIQSLSCSIIPPTVAKERGVQWAGPLLRGLSSPILPLGPPFHHSRCSFCRWRHHHVLKHSLWAGPRGRCDLQCGRVHGARCHCPGRDPRPARCRLCDPRWPHLEHRDKSSVRLSGRRWGVCELPCLGAWGQGPKCRPVSR